MKQEEERTFENALAWDEEFVDMDTALESARINNEESERFFKEAVVQTIGKCGDPVLLEHRRKRTGANLAKHWFIYEYPDRKEVRLFTSDQRIDGENYSFMGGENELIFFY
jgi:hypothetical protein